MTSFAASRVDTLELPATDGHEIRLSLMHQTCAGAASYIVRYQRLDATKARITDVLLVHPTSCAELCRRAPAAARQDGRMPDLVPASPSESHSGNVSVAVAVVLGLVLVAAGKVATVVISVNAASQEDPAAAMRGAAYWSLMQVGGALIAAMALVWYAIGQRSDRVVAGGALIAAALLMSGQV